MCGRNKKNVFYFKLTLLRLDETSGKEDKQPLLIVNHAKILSMRLSGL